LRISIPQSRFSIRILELAFLFMMSTATLVVPIRALALQTPEPPAQPEVMSPSSEPKPQTEAAKTEESENDQYRHSPMVQSLAKLLHLDVESTARLFEIINVSVVILAIVIPLVRIMPMLLRKRSEKVRSDIESARKVTEDANERLSVVEAKLANLGDEISKFRTEVEREILQDEARIKAALEEESVRIVSAAEQEIILAAAQARRGLRSFAADLAIEQAAKQLVLTPDTDRALIAEFVRETGKGGQN
jgi:F-type H+-transporting ATPase subunit b